jgi:hypothetical protein
MPLLGNGYEIAQLAEVDVTPLIYKNYLISLSYIFDKWRSSPHIHH